MARFNIKKNGVVHCSGDDPSTFCQPCRAIVEACQCQHCLADRAEQDLRSLSADEIRALAKQQLLASRKQNSGVPPPPPLFAARQNQPAPSTGVNEYGIPNAPALGSVKR